MAHRVGGHPLEFVSGFGAAAEMREHTNLAASVENDPERRVGRAEISQRNKPLT
jgi:hypothetical protein